MSIEVRRCLAVAGMGLWLAYPFVFSSGGLAVHQHRCAKEKSILEGLDPCLRDGLPVLEMGAFFLTVVLAYAFGRFAFTLFAPPVETRGNGWGLAGSSDASDYFPALQWAALVGLGWALLHARAYPLELYPYLIYWAAWFAWFGMGLWLSWPTGHPGN